MAAQPMRITMTRARAMALRNWSPSRGVNMLAATNTMTAKEKAAMPICPGTMGPKLHTPYGIAARTAVHAHHTADTSPDGGNALPA